jgi:hypothetical protein
VHRRPRRGGRLEVGRGEERPVERERDALARLVEQLDTALELLGPLVERPGRRVCPSLDDVREGDEEREALRARELAQARPDSTAASDSPSKECSRPL